MFDPRTVVRDAAEHSAVPLLDPGDLEHTCGQESVPGRGGGGGGEGERERGGGAGLGKERRTKRGGKSPPVGVSTKMASFPTANISF